MMNDNLFNYEELERSNFLTWMRISPMEEILDAWRNHREKMRYLMGKYGDEIDRSPLFTSLPKGDERGICDLGKEELRNGE